MIHIAVCDDKIEELEQIHQILQNYRKERPDIDFFLRRFQSSYDLLEAIEASGHYQLYLLDILMPNINGIQVGEIIRRSDNAALILYLTSSPDFALESYQVKAQGYLLKPIDEPKLFAVLDELLEKLESEEPKRLLVRTRNEVKSIPFGKLLYVEYYSHRLRCHLTDQTITESLQSRLSFDEIVKNLCCDSRFVKISSSYMINMSHVQSLTKSGFVMDDGSTLTITRTYTEARQIFFDYLLERGRSL